MDDFILSHTRDNASLDAMRRSIVQREGSALLCIELYADEADALPPRLERLARDLAASFPGCRTRALTDATTQARVWHLREAALGLSMATRGDGKAISFVEDTAVAPERLREYIARFLQIVERHRTTAGVYAHASVGCLHVRPVVDMKTADGIATFESIASEVADLVLEFGGALSGEHGDGLVRGAFNERMFGPTLYEAFRTVKRTFDPDGLFNPGRIVDTPPITAHLRFGAGYQTPNPATHFDYEGSGGFGRAVEMCSGVGACRKTREGTMCPSYMATRDEAHSTRGRANVLRLALNGRMQESGLDADAVRGVLDLCLECRACKSECPVNVDVGRYKSEFLARYWTEHGTPLKARAFGYVDEIAAWGSRFAPIANRLASSTMGRRLAEAAVGLDPRRTPPLWAAKTLRHQLASRLDSRADGTPVLFADTFTSHVEPEIGVAAFDVLVTSGLGATLAPHVCCGRPLISQGLLTEARDRAARNVAALYPRAARGSPIVFVEPSCLSAVREDAPDLLRGSLRDKARVVADRAVLFEEYLESALAAGRASLVLRPGPRDHPPPRALPPAIDGAGRRGGGPAPADSGRRGHRSRCGLLRHGGVLRLHIRPLRRVAGHRRAQAPAGRASDGRQRGARGRGNVVPTPGGALHRRARHPPCRPRSRFDGEGARMNLAWISLLALAVAITLSMFTQVNVGVVSLALAWLVGVYLGGFPLNTVIGTFPIQLFLTLAGVTLLFGMAAANGTLGRVAARAVHICRGNAGLIPVMFFAIAAVLSSIGPGNISTTAIMAPMAMAVSGQAGIPPFLMALMVGNGAQAGALSPFAPTGVIVNGIMERIGLDGYELRTYLNNLVAHVAVTFVAYFIFGGLKLFKQGSKEIDDSKAVHLEPFAPVHWLTLAVLASLVIGVIGWDLQVGMAALTGAALLSLVGAANEKEAIKKMPWGVVLMVCGVTVLIGVLEKTQGMALFSDLLARISTPGSATFVVALVTGIVSVYSSTSGVVLPAFLPTVPGLVENLGGGAALGIASAMMVGGHLVDLSPLSTIGALCIAALPAGDHTKLFNQLLAWGLSMTVVGAVICWVLF